MNNTENKIRYPMRESHENIMDNIACEFFPFELNEYGDPEYGYTFRCEVDTELSVDRWCHLPWSIRSESVSEDTDEQIDIDVADIKKWLSDLYPDVLNQLEQISILRNKSTNSIMICLDSVGFRRMSNDVCRQSQSWRIHDWDGDIIDKETSSGLFYEMFENDSVSEDYFFESSLILRPDSEIEKHAKELNYLQ